LLNIAKLPLFLNQDVGGKRNREDARMFYMTDVNSQAEVHFLT
jgi:hypothetical protein